MSQINDEHLHLVRCLLDEVFGKDNSCAGGTIQGHIVWNLRASSGAMGTEPRPIQTMRRTRKESLRSPMQNQASTRRMTGHTRNN
jgi:hypothetical protein